VETLGFAGSCRDKGAEDFSPEFQVALPYRGIFVWHVGHDDVVGDTNQVLFVRGGEAYRISHPLPDGYSELIITPALDVLSEIAEAGEASLRAHSLFKRRCRRAPPRLQARRARFLSWATAAGDEDVLRAEEEVIGLLRSTLSDGGRYERPSPSTVRLIRRTKEFLEAELANPVRLGDVGRAVGASAPYLTHVFRRFEGASLHQYLTHLRLSRALDELPHANDLTTLALDLGFSSHSHFTAAFRRTYGLTPSRFRTMSRTSRPTGSCSTSDGRAYESSVRGETALVAGPARDPRVEA
jgi:AraC-like DNA-binding protein